MFDYFADLLSGGPRRQGTIVAREPNTRTPLRYIQSPVPSAVNVGSTYNPPVVPMDNGTGSGDPATAGVRPRIVPLADTPPPPVSEPAPPGLIQDPLQQKLRLARQQTAQLMDTKSDPMYDANGTQIGGRVVNNDHGVLGRLGDILRQAVISAGEAYNNGSGDPGQRLMSAIGGGIAGGVGGGFRPTLDEERQRLYDINRSRQNEGIAQSQIDADLGTRLRKAQVGSIEAQPAIDQYKNETNRMGIKADSLKAQQQLVFNTWQEKVKNGGFKMDDPSNSDLVLQARALGVPISDAEPGAKFFGSWSPDGHFAVMNESTGKVQLGLDGQSYVKPPTITESDLPDERFNPAGLLSDKEIEARAQAAVAPDINGIAVNPQTEQDLVNYQNTNGEFPYRNEDGTLNKNKFLQDTALGLAPMQYSTLYRSQGKSIADKIAAQKEQLMTGQRDLRSKVAEFRLLVKGKTPEVANDAVDLFNRAMQVKDKKKRDAALKALKESLR